MLRLLLLFIFCSRLTAVFAQSEAFRISMLYDATTLLPDAWLLNKPEIRDSTLLTVTYRMTYVVDPVSGKERTNLLMLQIGEVWRKYYSLMSEDRDVNTERVLIAGRGRAFGSSPIPADRQNRDPGGYAGINGEFWIAPDGRIDERYHSMLRGNESIEYTDPAPDFAWTLHPDTMTVGGKYVCSKATSRFRGRDWIVWYTTDIPLRTGPWKFGGLPGLILRAEDAAGEYRWECVGLSTDVEPIVYYRIARTTRTTREKYRALERYAHEQPLQFFSQDIPTTVYTKGNVQLDDSWTIPYNPIERE